MRYSYFSDVLNHIDQHNMIWSCGRVFTDGGAPRCLSFLHKLQWRLSLVKPWSIEWKQWMNSSCCGSHGNARKKACKKVDGEVDGESIEGGWANLQEREFLASKRRNSMWNFGQCAEIWAAYHYSKSSLQ